MRDDFVRPLLAHHALQQEESLARDHDGLMDRQAGSGRSVDGRGDQLVGGKPIYLYIIGQSFNLILTLLMSWIAFGGIIFAPFTG